LAQELEKATPPADARDFNDRLVAELRSAAGLLRQGKGEDSFLGLRNIRPAPEVISRLDRVAARDPDCEESAFPGFALSGRPLSSQ